MENVIYNELRMRGYIDHECIWLFIEFRFVGIIGESREINSDEAYYHSYGDTSLLFYMRLK